MSSSTTSMIVAAPLSVLVVTKLLGINYNYFLGELLSLEFYLLFYTDSCQNNFHDLLQLQFHLLLHSHCNNSWDIQIFVAFPILAQHFKFFFIVENAIIMIYLNGFHKLPIVIFGSKHKNGHIMNQWKLNHSSH